jgi:hypothetical protein
MENARESNGIAFYEKPNSIITHTDSIGIIFSFEFFNIADINLLFKPMSRTPPSLPLSRGDFDKLSRTVINLSQTFIKLI